MGHSASRPNIPRGRHLWPWDKLWRYGYTSSTPGEPVWKRQF